MILSILNPLTDIKSGLRKINLQKSPNLIKMGWKSKNKSIQSPIFKKIFG